MSILYYFIKVISVFFSISAARGRDGVETFPVLRTMGVGTGITRV